RLQISDFKEGLGRRGMADSKIADSKGARGTGGIPDSTKGGARTRVGDREAEDFRLHADFRFQRGARTPGGWQIQNSRFQKGTAMNRRIADSEFQISKGRGEPEPSGFAKLYQIPKGRAGTRVWGRGGGGLQIADFRFQRTTRILDATLIQQYA